MGYWGYSGGFTPSPVLVQYQLTSTVGTANWDNAYLNIKNYNIIEKLSSEDPNLGNYKGIAQIMQAFVFQRIVDLYNNAPYTEALSSSSNTTPAYDKGSDIYDSLLLKVNSSIAAINAAAANKDAENPGDYDVLFRGDMDMWLKFANTLKLKLVMRLTETADGPAIAKTELAGLTSASFLGAGEDAGVNPGYSTAANNQENPYYLNVAYTVTGAPGTNNTYWRASSYAVDFYKNNNDPRDSFFYAYNKAGNIQGRKIGSTASGEGNDNISGVNGPGKC
ncbi:MAG: SusD/RagB family nutrient-binding outer membrane lipoprotein [Segetibacter sp.]